MKKVVTMLLALPMSVCLAACGSGKHSVSEEGVSAAEVIPTHSVEMTIDCEGNLLFSKYDVDVYIDEEEVGTVGHGSENTFDVQLTEGQHELQFHEEGKTQTKKPRAKKATAKEKTVEAVEAELIQEKGGVGVNGNLIPLSQRSKKVQREIQEKGRQKNKENWQKKKEQREIFNDILDMAVSGKIKENLEFLGISPEYMTWNVAMYLSLMVDAVNKHNINAFRTAMEYAGRAPLQEIRENETKKMIITLFMMTILEG